MGGVFPRDYANYVLGRDFLNFWIYGREAWDPSGAARFYDIGFYNEHLRALIPWEYPTQQWSYPPHILLLAAPFGLLPYGFAYALWTALGFCAFYFAVYRDGDWHDNAALLLAPAAVVCIISGQNSFLTAAALIAGLEAHASYYVQAIVALVVTVAVIWVFIRPRDPLLSYCALLVGNALLTPYLMSYDLVLMGWLVLTVYRAPLAAAERKVLLALYWLPVIALSMAMLGLPGSVLILMATGIVLIHALARGPGAAILPRQKAP